MENIRQGRENDRAEMFELIRSPSWPRKPPQVTAGGRKEGKGEVEHKVDEIYKEEEARYDEQRNGKPREKGIMR